jgi:tetratricopeptide (TPR) repeat protein
MNEGSLMKTLHKTTVHNQTGPSALSETLMLGFPGKRNLQSAEESLRKTVRLSPLDDQAHLLLGKVLFFQGKYEASERVLREAVRLNPNNVISHYYRGVVFLTQRKYEEAEQEFRHIVQKNPKDNVALGILATALSLQGKTSSALEIWNRARSAERDPQRPWRMQVVMT